MYGVIYKITNLINGKSYVGQTSRSLEKRIAEHAKADSFIGKAIRKYGRENFSVEVIEECDTPDRLNEREIFWIREINSKVPNGYNLTDGGEGTHGLTEESLNKLRRKRSPETLALMSAVQKKRANTPEGKATLDKARKSRWEKEKARPPEQRGWIRCCRKNIYPVLEAELVSRKIKFSQIACQLNITGATFARKINGTVCITIEEAKAIRNFLGVDLSLEELFRRDDGSIPDMTPKSYVYPVLAAILQKRRITFKPLSKVLGIDKSTVSYKMRGKSEFSPEQKAAIRDFLQVDTPLDVLFSRRE